MKTIEIGILKRLATVSTVIAPEKKPLLFPRYQRAGKLSCICTAILLAACSGGAGEGGQSDGSRSLADPVPVSVPEPASELADFRPDETKLMSDAEDSSQLYVDQSFKFTSTTPVTFTFKASDSLGAVMAGKRLRIYLIADGIDAWEDSQEAEKSLLHTGRTNVNGEHNVSLDLPHGHQNFLVELAVVGIENRVVLKADEAVVSYHFR